MGAERYEILSTLPPGAGSRTRLGWQAGDGGFRRPVVLREVAAGTAVSVAPSSPEGVLPLLDLVELEGKKWAVYPFIPGATFSEVAEAHFAVDRLPSLGMIARVVIDACRAIHRVHCFVDPLGLTPAQKHGGLSDAALLVGFDGQTRVLDLGARRSGKFLAPEVIRGEAIDARADVFSLGAVLHHATTRFERVYAVTIAKAPSRSEFPPPSMVHPEASPPLDAVVMRALMPTPSSRFATTAQLADELEKVLGPNLFTQQQVHEVLQPLFGERMAALRDLVDPKRRPPPSAPRAPASRPSAPRSSKASLPLIPGLDVELDSGAPVAIEDMPTQSNIRLKAQQLAAQPAPNFDPHATNPGPRPSRPSAPRPAMAVAVDDQDKQRARGQERISTHPQLPAVQVAPEDEPALGMEPDVPTNVRPRVTGSAPAVAVREDPNRRVITQDVDPIPRASSQRAQRIVLGLLALIILGSGTSVVVLRPELVEQLRARLQPPPVEPVVEELDAGEAVVESDGGAPEEVAVVVTPTPEETSAAEPDASVPDAGAEDALAAAIDAGAPDAGTGEPDAGTLDAGAPDAGTRKAPAGEKKKKKKKRNR